jgi:hypothetical protein
MLENLKIRVHSDVNRGLFTEKPNATFNYIFDEKHSYYFPVEVDDKFCI